MFVSEVDLQMQSSFPYWSSSYSHFLSCLPFPSFYSQIISVGLYVTDAFYNLLQLQPHICRLGCNIIVDVIHFIE